MGDINKLPKWAQKELEDRDRTVRMYQRRVSELEDILAGKGTGPFILGTGFKDGEKRLSTRYLGVELGKDLFRLHAREDGKLEVMCSTMFGRDFVVSPRSGNVVEIFTTS